MTAEPMYELTASRRGLIEVHGKLIENADRIESLPKKPADFRPLIGTYYRVSTEAVRRNDAQMRSGFLDYLYAPEPYKADKPVAQ